MKPMNIVMIVAGVALVACEEGPSYSYYRINAKFVASAQDQQPPEIIPTPSYARLAGQATTVAVRAPDRCTNSTTNQVTGDAAAAGSILQTNCGVEMGEIERALTRAGYNVISWKIVDREMARNTSATDVAATLGAEVLFQINSLENSGKTLGQDARWERTYFTANPSGAAVAPMALTEETRNYLSTTYLAPIEAKQNVSAYAVTLDASAIWVKTGQSIWYYRWTRAAQPSDVAASYSLVLQCLQGYGLGQCQSIRPATAQGPSSTVVATGESVGISASERPEDKARAVYAELFKEVVADFVGSFAKARKS